MDVSSVGSTNKAFVCYPDDKRGATRDQLLALARAQATSVLDWEKVAHKVQHSLGFTSAQPEELRKMMFWNVAFRLRTMATSGGKITRPTRMQWQKKPKLRPARSRLALLLLAGAYADPAPGEGPVWRSDLEHVLAVKHKEQGLLPKETWELRCDTSQGKSREAPHVDWPTVGLTWVRTDEGADPSDACWGSESLGNLLFLLSFRNERHSSEAQESFGKLVCVSALARVRNINGCVLKCACDNKGVMDGKLHELVTFAAEGMLHAMSMRAGFALEDTHLPRAQLQLQDDLSKGIIPPGLKGTRLSDLGAADLSAQLDILLQSVVQWGPAQKVFLQPRHRFVDRKNRPEGWESISHSRDLSLFLDTICPHIKEERISNPWHVSNNSGGPGVEEGAGGPVAVLQEARLARVGHFQSGGGQGGRHNEDLPGDCHQNAGKVLS